MPNLITSVRLVLLVPFIYFAFQDTFTAKYFAAAIIGLAGITDWLDGFIARKTERVTEFGEIFDPAADRIFFISTGAAMVIKGLIPPAAGLLVVIRDLVMMAGFKLLERSGQKPKINYFGKTTTFILFCSLVYAVLALPFAGPVFWAAALLNLASGLNYARLYLVK